MLRQQINFPSAALLGLVLLGAARVNADDLRAYEFKDQGFTLSAPANWIAPTLDKVKAPHLVLILRPSEHAAAGTLLPTLEIIVSADQILKDSLLPQEVAGYRKLLETQFPDRVLDADQETTIDGAKGVRIGYSGTARGHVRRGSTVVVIHNGRLYMLSWFADPSVAASFAPGFQKVLDSFKWTDPEMTAYLSPDSTAGLCYPRGWFVKDGAPQPKISFLSTEKPTAAVPGNEISLATYPATPDLTLETLVKTYKDRLIQAQPGLRFSADEAVMLARYPGWKLERDLQLPGQGVTHRVVLFTIVGGKSYFLSFVTPQADYDAMRPTFDAVAASFRATGATALSGPPKVYEFKDLHYRVTAKASWLKRELTGLPLDDNSALSLYFDPSKSKRGTYTSSLVVVVSKYLGMADNDLAPAAEAGRQTLSKSRPGAVFTGAEPTTLDGFKAVRISFTQTTSSPPVKGFEVVTVRHGRFYDVTFAADPQTYDASVAEAQKVIDSFKWIDGAEPVVTKTYEVKDRGFKLDAPSPWATSPSDPGKDKFTALALYFDPVNLANGGLFVMVDDETYKDDQLAAQATRFRTNQMKHAGVLVADDEEITLDGVKAIRVPFTHTTGSPPRRGFQIVAIRNGKCYNLIFSVDSTLYKSVRPEVQKIIDSFKWTD